MEKISTIEVQSILDNSNSLPKAINKIKSLLHSQGYTDYSDNDRLLFINSSGGSAHTIDISLDKYKTTSSVVKINNNMIGTGRIEDTNNVIQASSLMKNEMLEKETSFLPKAGFGLFDSIKKKVIGDRVKDEILFEYVFTELEHDIKYKGLWAKAYAESAGDNDKVEPLYMQYRVQSIKDSLSAMQISFNKMTREQLFELIKNKVN